jgi:hypothetical protein
MLIPPVPSAEDQLRFLSNIQRVFAEGDFTATYKFALLIALADLAVELGADDGRELVLSTRQIGERFIQMYWRQSPPLQQRVTRLITRSFGARSPFVSLSIPRETERRTHTKPRSRSISPH